MFFLKLSGNPFDRERAIRAVARWGYERELAVGAQFFRLRGSNLDTGGEKRGNGGRRGGRGDRGGD